MARKNILDITAQKFAAKKLALRRMILRKLATRRLAARKTAALGMVMLLLGGCHVAQLTTLYTDETSVEENGIRYDAAHRPITGVYQKYADNMQLQEEIHYVDGKISGLYKAYDRDGSVLLEAYYKKGQPHGKTVEYYPDGAEKEVCYYRKGKPEGGEIAYYPNGDLRRKGSYLRGKKNGVFEEYYKNGAVKTSITYRRGSSTARPASIRRATTSSATRNTSTANAKDRPFPIMTTSSRKFWHTAKMTSWTARPKNLTAGANWCAWLPIRTARKLRA